MSRKIAFRRRIVSRGEPRLVIALTGREPLEGRTQSRLLRRALLAVVAAIFIVFVVIFITGPPQPPAK